MRNVVLYIAVSLDGYIATPTGGVDFLDEFQTAGEGDYGYQDFISTVDTCIMGSQTYRAILNFGFPWPYPDQMTYVMTSNPQLTVDSPNTFIAKQGITATIQELKQQEGNQAIWLVGGGQLVGSVLEENLLDQMIITVIPKILGEGIRLFPPQSKASRWQLVESTTHASGVAVMRYEKIKKEI